MSFLNKYEQVLDGYKLMLKQISDIEEEFINETNALETVFSNTCQKIIFQDDKKEDEQLFNKISELKEMMQSGEQKKNYNKFNSIIENMKQTSEEEIKCMTELFYKLKSKIDEISVL